VGTLGLSHPPIEKGLSPASAEYATAWLFIVMLVGLAHVSVGYVFGFAEYVQGHGLRDAVMEKASWLLLMLGVWVWILSRSAEGMKPAFVFEALNGHPFPLGFAGFSAEVGLVALVVAAVGLVLMVAAEFFHFGTAGILIGLLESMNVLVNVLSYARVAAVLLAKAGMAFVVNLLFFGVYAVEEPAEYHFMLSHGPAYVMEHEPEANVLFPGLIHMGAEGAAVGIIALVGGLIILVVGHLIVLALGVTSAGLQAVRLEYVEFFSKFYYEGGAGEAYEPFGRESRFSASD
jgi:V/A-type H+-transporting ATPase subunit I